MCTQKVTRSTLMSLLLIINSWNGDYKVLSRSVNSHSSKISTLLNSSNWRTMPGLAIYMWLPTRMLQQWQASTSAASLFVRSGPRHAFKFNTSRLTHTVQWHYLILYIIIFVCPSFTGGRRKRFDPTTQASCCISVHGALKVRIRRPLRMAVMAL